ncbi:MAG: DsbA family protein [Brevundimonas sp.]|uniref:DsbA family protein n=1 Tax=Brevundimonas sp. TaxID=1871086 RepID=UPI0027373832|nr:DsbA family protein [Brevundimonas sp.]MDP3404122.1 DsbA family protein [Brevundimonas sp.]
MGLRALIGPMVAGTITSTRLRDARRRQFEAGRVRAHRPHEVLYFHQVDDPWSTLTAQRLAAVAIQYGVTITPHLVSPPPGWAAPERERLQAYARRDAALIAPAYRLGFEGRSQPSPGEVHRAQLILQAAITSEWFFEAASVVGGALWSGQSLNTAEMAFGAAEPAAVLTALAAGDRLRERLGHYLGGTLYHAGEWYWGLDRLGDLETRLEALGCGHGPTGRPVAERTGVRLAQTAFAADSSTPALEFFLSFRSPYTWLAMDRTRALANHYGVALRLRFVLPMVMRGLPVPPTKRNYILRDCKREAERLDLPFGRVCDPVGRPVERGLAILHGAIATGHGPEFASSFLRGVFAEGVDAGSDRGLRRLVERAGLDWPQARVWMQDESWRAVAEENRQAMFNEDLWGVPSFRFGGLATWGQDRLWLVENAIIETLGGARQSGSATARKTMA